MATPVFRGRIPRGIAYGLFALAAFLFFLWWMLPYPEIARNAEARLRAQGISAQILDLGPGSFPGVRARAVRLGPLTSPETSLELSDVRASIPLLGLVSGRMDVRFRAETLGGTLQGRVAVAGNRAVEASWEGLELSRIPLPPEVSEVPLTGRSDGQLEAVVDADNPLQSSGKAEIRFQGVKVGAGKAMGFPVPEVLLGNGQLKLAGEGGKLEVENGVFQDGDLGIEFSGNLLLRPDVARSLVNGILSLRPAEKAAQELALLFAVFPGGRASDGRYTARVRGTLGAPRLLAR
jgi:type II secretion system protein N